MSLEFLHDLIHNIQGFCYCLSVVPLKSLPTVKVSHSIVYTEINYRSVKR